MPLCRDPGIGRRQKATNDHKPRHSISIRTHTILPHAFIALHFSQVHEGEEIAPDAVGQPQIDVKTLLDQLDSEIAAECPRNGEIVLRLIDMPFINPELQRREIVSWGITLRNRL